MNYFMSLDPLALFRSMPGAFAQGMVWGLMALGVYITYRLLDFADLTVDGSLATGGAVAVMLIRGGMSPWAALIFAFLAGMAAGFITGILHTALGIPGILASILTQISLYSINLNIMGCSNQAVSVDKYPLVVSLRYLSDSNSTRVQIFATCILFCFAIVAILYWYFGTEQGHAIRATGCNQQMARAQGINTNLHTVIALMISPAVSTPSIRVRRTSTWGVVPSSSVSPPSSSGKSFSADSAPGKIWRSPTRCFP